MLQSKTKLQNLEENTAQHVEKSLILAVRRTVAELGLYCPQDSQQNDAFPFTAGILICVSSIHLVHISRTCSIHSDKSIPGSVWAGHSATGAAGLALTFLHVSKS